MNYQQAFTNTYLYGCYSPIDGSHFTWEVEGVDTLVFEAYLKAFSLHKPEELKVVIIDNAGFYSTKNIIISNNIKLIRVPPYTFELNPCEKAWQYLKERFKNKTFKNIEELKKWLHQTVKEQITTENIISIVKSDFYIKSFKLVLIYNWYNTHNPQQLLSNSVLFIITTSLAFHTDLISF